jgi:hypothetical protein
LSVDPLARCVADYAFWAETCYRIRDKFGRVIPFRLNPIQQRIGQIEQDALRTHGRARLYVLKGRQGGISTDQQARNLHQICTEPGFDAITLAHIREDTDKLFGITKRALDYFPETLRPPFGEKETREVSIPEMDAAFWTGTAGAKRTGRGLTLKRVHGSEFAFWDQPRMTLAAITPALVPQGSIVTLETTASGFGSEGHEFWKEAEAGENGYVPVFVPWWQCDVDNYRLPLLADDELGSLTDEEQAFTTMHGLDLEQIKWRRDRIAEMQRGPFLQEYAEDPETCWAASGGMFYDAELIRSLMPRCPKPIDTDWGGALEIYGDLLHGEEAIGGADTAEGVGGDASAFVIRAYPSWRLLAVFKDKGIEPKALAGMLNTQGRRFGMVFWVIEKNMHGITVLREMRDTFEYPAAMLYHRTVHDKSQKEHSEMIGWATSAASKPLMLDAGRDLLNAARDRVAGVPSQSALRDALGVRRDDKGKIDLNGRDIWVSETLAWIGRDARVPVFV